jgi:hypothetical protein
MFSHEKVNSGFLCGLRLAFPDERIRFYGDETHIAALQKILAHDGVVIDNIEYVPICFSAKPGIMRFLNYRLLLRTVLRGAREAGSDKVFFLSYNPEILYLLKKLKQGREFQAMKFSLVLHGGFEDIADDIIDLKAKAPTTFLARKKNAERVRRIRLADVPVKAARVVARVLKERLAPWNILSRSLFTERKMLLWRHSGDFHYVSLSSHATVCASRYLDADRLNIHTVTLPTVFAAPSPRPQNEYAKFAMFGYGDSLMLYGLLCDLANRDITVPYEIRVIGMDNRGIQGFANATCVSPGRPLEREEMEKSAQDIDMFIILYDKSRYRLSCSGSILEALSYLKPVLHLDNDCVNHFNRDDTPIGVRCESISGLADKIQEIVESYGSYGPQLDAFRANMFKMRAEHSIEQSKDALRASFTW